MLVATDNKTLVSDNYPCVSNQGQLLLALTKSPQEEVLLDKDLPGRLSLNDLLRIILVKYPEVQISIIEDPVKEVKTEIIETKKTGVKTKPILISAVIVLAYLIWAFSYGNPNPIWIISVIGVLCAGGIIWQRELR